MYLRPVHSTFHLPTIYKFIQTNPLGLLTTYIPHPEIPALQSSHIPWIIDLPSDITSKDLSNTDLHTSDPRLSASARQTSDLPLGTLRAHLSRANPQAKALIAAARAASPSLDSTSSDLPSGGVTLSSEILLTFTGPLQSYITPKFYTATKPSTGKVVPTWNYEAVEAYGEITVYPSTTSDEADEFLSKAIKDLSHWSEVEVMEYDGKEGRKGEWEVSDAPERYTGALKKAIVGVEVRITRLGGKWKMSQEMGEGDREGVVSGLREGGREDVAEMVRKLGVK